MEYCIIDVDTHITEPPDVWTARKLLWDNAAALYRIESPLPAAV